MEPSTFASQAKVVIVAGKGGVGKTTVSAAFALMASRSGLRTLIVEVEGRSGITALFDRPEPLAYEQAVMVPAGQGCAGVEARTLTPDDALVEYLVDHGLERVSKRLVSSGVLDVVSTAVPGLRDILVLGKVKSLEKSAEYDLIVVDAPAAGHAVTFLTSARGLLDAFRVGPVRTQAQDVVDLLSDSSRCQVMLVTLPEETPVNEAAETAFALEDKVGVSLLPVVVNAVYPELAGLDGPAPSGVSAADAEALRRAAAFRSARRSMHEEQLKRLADDLPLPQIVLPYLFTTELGLPQIERLAGCLAEGISALASPSGAR